MTIRPFEQALGRFFRHCLTSGPCEAFAAESVRPGRYAPSDTMTYRRLEP